MISRLFLFIFLLTALSLTSAQDVKLCYEHDYDAASQIDTFKIYLKGNPDTTISIRAVNVSIAFHDSCATFDTLFSYFSGAWSPFFEMTRLTHNLSLTYNRRTYGSRFQYGNSDPGIPMAHPIPVPASNADSLLIFKFVFQGSCSQKLYVENQSENSLNQFGDISFDPIDYAYHPCQGRDSVHFCTRQARDSASMRDSLRIFIEGHEAKSIGISELSFSVAFRDSCAQFDSLQSVLNSMWGDTLAYIAVEDSLQLSYGGNAYDARLTYRHQNPNFSATNLLLTPAQTRFPDWVCTLFFSGTCSQYIYIEKLDDQPSNLILNQLDEVLLYDFRNCDSLPEDTLVLGLGSDLSSDWLFYPNPVKDILSIKGLQEADFSGKIQLINMQGQLLREKTIPFPTKVLSLSLEDFPPAIYLVKIRGDKGEFLSFKFIKE